jgi:4-carboxymuconolactone decarboxylase
MKLFTSAIVTLALVASAQAQGTDAMTSTMPKSNLALSRNDIRTVAPALDRHAQDRLFGEVWKRPGLGARDRSIITVAALIARNQTIEMPFYFDRALNNGVKPAELSEIITHLAFYSGWANAMSAISVASMIFAERNIGADQLPTVAPMPLSLDEAAEADRAMRVSEQFGAATCGCVRSSRRAIAAWSRSAR